MFAYHIELSLHKTSDRDSHKQDFYTAFRTAIYTGGQNIFVLPNYYVKRFSMGKAPSSVILLFKSKVKLRINSAWINFTTN